MNMNNERALGWPRNTGSRQSRPFEGKVGSCISQYPSQRWSLLQRWATSDLFWDIPNMKNHDQSDHNATIRILMKMVTCSEIKSIRFEKRCNQYLVLFQEKIKLPHGETESLKILDTKERFKQIFVFIGAGLASRWWHSPSTKTLPGLWLTISLLQGFFPATLNQIIFLPH